MEYRFNIEGMTCASCAARIQSAFSNNSSIEVGNVNFANNTAYVKGDLSQDEIASIVYDLGYKALFTDHERSLSEIEANEARELKSRKQSLFISFILTFPVFLLGMGFISFNGDGYVQLLLTSTVMAWPGRSFYQVAFRLLRKFSANMDSLVALGTGAAWCYSLFLLFTGGKHFYFESAAVIISLVLLGKYLEDKAKRSAAAAIRGLSKLQPKTALLLEGNSERNVPISELQKGDLVLVRAGEKVPTDGIIAFGYTDLDESLITGESLPVTREVDEKVTGGTINVGNNVIKVTVTQVGSETMLAQLIKLVADAQGSKPKLQRLADKISLYFVPAALIIALITFLWWFFIIDAQFAGALVPAVSVLVIACPCALGLATPAAIIAATGRAAERHILIRTAEAIERAQKINAIVFDKTGTLTKGKPEVWKVLLQDENKKEEFLSIAYTLEYNSLHPLAEGIKKFCKENASTKMNLISFEEITGKGLRGVIENKECLIGKKEFLLSHDIQIPDVWADIEKDDAGLVYMAVNGEAALLFALKDPIRGSANSATEHLKSLGIKLILATGDRKEIAENIANSLGISEIHAAMSPQQKLELIKTLKAQGLKVAMVGDGINDAPALAASDLGIALGSGTDIAMDAANLILPKGDLSRVAEALSLSKSTIQIIRQNLFWAFIYNTVSIPLAAMGFLSPMIASSAMAFSSVSVVLNSIRLRKFTMV
ncbi:MAG: heavy metal translocating P-type ATPase [Bdellovibrionota bacterium]